MEDDVLGGIILNIYFLISGAMAAGALAAFISAAVIKIREKGEK